MDFNGSNVILSKLTGEIVGQMDMTISRGGSPIDVTNRSLGGWRILLDGELSAKDITIDATITFSDDVIYRQVVAEAIAGISSHYKVLYPDGTFFISYMTPHNLSYTASRGAALTTSLTLSSSQDVDTTGQPTDALITVLYPVQFIEDKPIVGAVSIDFISKLELIFEWPVMAGSVGIDEITVESTSSEYTENEKEITQTVSIDSIVQLEVLVQYTEAEKEIMNTVSIDSIVQVEVLVPYAETEKEIMNTVSITEITKA